MIPVTRKATEVEDLNFPPPLTPGRVNLLDKTSLALRYRAQEMLGERHPKKASRFSLLSQALPLHLFP